LLALVSLPLIAQTPLASEPFTGNAGALNGFADGTVWAGGWQVQNSNTTVPGYNVATASPSGGGSYAVGGINWQMAGRSLDTTATGPFASYLSGGAIGKAGQTLYFSLMMRMDKATTDELSMTLHPGVNPAWYVTAPGVAVGFFGPASTRPKAFRSIAYNGGTGAGESSIDEIRFAASFAALSGSTTPTPTPTPTPAPTPSPAAHPALGTNLSAVADYSRELPFVDVFKMARPWISQGTGLPWGQGPALAVDANGWITSLQAGQWAETILLDNALDDQAHYPTGQYTVLYDGEGTIAFDLQSAGIVSQTPGRMVVNVPAGGNGVYLMVTATNPANPLRNIRFIMPGYESSYVAQPFNPAFLQSVQSYKTLRFMEWGLTNGRTCRTGPTARCRRTTRGRCAACRSRRRFSWRTR